MEVPCNFHWSSMHDFVWVINTTPNITNTTPNITNTMPNITNATPNITNTTSNITNTMPNIINTMPNITNTMPNITNTTPNITNATPNSTNTTPNFTNTTPSNINTTPACHNVWNVKSFCEGWCWYLCCAAVLWRLSDGCRWSVWRRLAAESVLPGLPRNTLVTVSESSGEKVAGRLLLALLCAAPQQRYCHHTMHTGIRPSVKHL